MKNTFEAAIDLFQILATSIQNVNVKNLVDFLSAIELDVKEPKTYKQAISGSYAQQWAYII